MWEWCAGGDVTSFGPHPLAQLRALGKGVQPLVYCLVSSHVGDGCVGGDARLGCGRQDNDTVQAAHRRGPFDRANYR